MNDTRRNIAYKQSAQQRSTYNDGTKHTADKAVDGNTDSYLENNSCSHTDNNDRLARFDLTFNTLYIINRFLLYNRVRQLSRLQTFRLQTLDVNKTIVDNYKDASNKEQEAYSIIGIGSRPIISLSINETRKTPNPSSPFVTLCELEAFGECPLGKWSLPCTKDCNTSCPTSCHRDDGSCNTVCAGYSNPPECTNACVSANWGINCANNCSTRCVDTSCDSKTGLCDRGCPGYSDPPYCTAECPTDGFWGINCSQPCSNNCMTNSCNIFTGTCDQGCKAGYQLPDCTQECPAGHWGSHCLQCKNCFDDEWNIFTGFCTYGCKDGFYFPNCTQGDEEPILDIISFGAGLGSSIAIGTIIFALSLICRNRDAKKYDHTYDDLHGQENDIHSYEYLQSKGQL